MEISSRVLRESHVLRKHISATLSLWSAPFPIERVSGCFFFFFLISRFTEIPILNADSVNPDQTPRSAASDLDLHYLLMFVLREGICFVVLRPSQPNGLMSSGVILPNHTFTGQT